MSPVYQLHDADEPVIHVQFASKRIKAHWWSRGDLIYDTQTYVEMPPELCDPYGLETKWGFCLQTPEQLAVFVQMKKEHYGKRPTLAIGGLFPCHTLPNQLDAAGGMAVTILEFDEPVDLLQREGLITLYTEHTPRRHTAA